MGVCSVVADSAPLFPPDCAHKITARCHKYDTAVRRVTHSEEATVGHANTHWPVELSIAAALSPSNRAHVSLRRQVEELQTTIVFIDYYKFFAPWCQAHRWWTIKLAISRSLSVELVAHLPRARPTCSPEACHTMFA